MMSSPEEIPPFDSSIPMVWARDGEFGSGGTLGADPGPEPGALF